MSFNELKQCTLSLLTSNKKAKQIRIIIVSNVNGEITLPAIPLWLFAH